ncbi:MAG: hypothetical protein WBA89_16050 [Microcoleus sp.]
MSPDDGLDAIVSDRSTVRSRYLGWLAIGRSGRSGATGSGPYRNYG